MTMRPLAAILCLFLAGCATATIEDAVPAGALAGAPSADAVQSAGSTQGQGQGQGPGGGNYPNLNAEPPAAAPQITEEQKASETAALRARRQQISGAGRSQPAGTSEADMRRLAQSHGEDVLRQIESE